MTTAQLLAFCKFQARRPATDAEMADADWYMLLTQAQKHWYELFASHFPRLMANKAQLMHSNAGATEFRFWDWVNGITTSWIEPYSILEIMDGKTGRPLIIGQPWDPQTDLVWATDNANDFIPYLHAPDQLTVSFTDGAPYARWMVPPLDITVSQEPQFPPNARILIAWHALVLWAARGGDNARDPSTFMDFEAMAWSGDPRVQGDVGILGKYKMQGYGMQVSGTGPSAFATAKWYHSSDLGTHG